MEQEQTQPEIPKQTTEDAQAELDRLMSMYNVPAKSIEQTTVNSQPSTDPSPLQVNVDTKTVPSPSAVSTPTAQVDPDAPFGRYQRGKLKGQPRKTPYISVKNGVQQLPPTPAPVSSEPPKLSGMLISGGLFLMLVNLCLPLFFSVVNNFFSKDKLNPEHLKLTKEQIKELDPVCDAAMKQASVTGNPVLLLILGICTAMGMNYMMWKMKQPTQPKNETQKSSN